MPDEFETWRSDPIVESVIEDLSPALETAFEDGDFFPSPDLPAPITASPHTVVAWEFHGRERLNRLARKEFAKERRPVVVRGLTVVVDVNGERLFHRYIDWAGVYDQLGMVPGRPGQGTSQTATIGRDAGENLVLVESQQKTEG